MSRPAYITGNPSGLKIELPRPKAQWVAALRVMLPPGDYIKANKSGTLWQIDAKWGRLVECMIKHYFTYTSIAWRGVDAVVVAEHVWRKKWDWVKDGGEWLDAPASVVGDDMRALFLFPDAPWELVEVAYRALSKLYHPDKPTGNHQEMQRINVAYQRLKDARNSNA